MYRFSNIFARILKFTNPLIFSFVIFVPIRFSQIYEFPLCNSQFFYLHEPRLRMSGNYFCGK